MVIAGTRREEVEMNRQSLKNTIGGAILGISLLLGVGVMSSITAQAQYRDDDYYRRNRDWEREQRRRDRDQQRRRDSGWWNGGYGNGNGRSDGYGNGNGRWDGYSNYGGNYDLRQTALNAGYNEGVRAGRKDRSHGDRYDYRDESAYQNAMKDYNSRFGDRRLYQEYFRQAFVNGYADGFRGY